MKKESETPRTDAESRNPRVGDATRYVVSREFAEHLERELAAANAIIASALKAMPVGYIPAHTPESLPGRVADIVGRYAEAERELAEARDTHAALYAGTLKLESELATAREALEWAQGELGKHTRPSPIDKALGLQPQGKDDL